MIFIDHNFFLAPHPTISKDFCNLHSFILIVSILRFKDLSTQLDIGLHMLYKKRFDSCHNCTILQKSKKKVFRIRKRKLCLDSFSYPNIGFF